VSGGDEEEEEEEEEGVCVARDPYQCVVVQLSLEPEKASLFEILRPNQLQSVHCFSTECSVLFRSLVL
jgi:hypothetical protein